MSHDVHQVAGVPNESLNNENADGKEDKKSFEDEIYSDSDSDSDDENVKRSNLIPFSISSSTDALQGRRDSMEDNHISIDKLYKRYPEKFKLFKEYGLVNSFYGIYDGHVGKRASSFVSDHLHDHIINNPNFEIDSFATENGRTLLLTTLPPPSHVPFKYGF